MLWAPDGRVCRGKDNPTLCPPPCGQVAKDLSGNTEVSPQGLAESPMVTSSSMALLLGGMAPHLKAIAAPLFSAEELEKDLVPGQAIAASRVIESQAEERAKQALPDGAQQAPL